MQIEQVRLEDIKPYENNPRLNDGAVEYRTGYQQTILLTI